MKKIVALFTMLLALGWSAANLAAAENSHKNHGAGEMSASDNMEKTPRAGTYEHTVIEKNIRAEFQVMSLESMNMKDQNGATHHVMLKLFHDPENHQIKEAIGKIKIVGPDNAEQINNLKNYNGIFAANFTFSKTGKYGVICLVKVGEKKHLFKFWYPHG